MEINDLFQKVSYLTSKYPNLSLVELKELRSLLSSVSSKCTDDIYDMEEHNY